MEKGDAIPKDQIDSEETLNKIRNQVRKEGYPVHEPYGMWDRLYVFNCDRLLLDFRGDLCWDDGPERTYRIISVKDAIGSSKPEHYSSPNGDLWSTVGAFFSEQSRIDHHHLNAVEYIIRCFDKGGVEDLKKAKVNLDRAIEMMEEDND